MEGCARHFSAHPYKYCLIIFKTGDMKKLPYIRFVTN